MTELWTTLIPLIVGSAVLPVQIAVTILLLRSGTGRVTAVAWIGGMTAVRLAQGLLFGLVLGAAVAETEDVDGQGPIVSTLLLLIAVLFYVTAARKLAKQPDEDAPPPRWMDAVATVTPARALLLGAGFVALSPKLWAFTLGAIGAIAEADLDQPLAITTFLVFVAAAESVHLAAIGLAYLAPARSVALLDQVAEWLRGNDRSIMITLGLVFGTWFTVKALVGFGIL